MIVTIKIDSVKVTSVRKAGLTIYDHDSCRLGTQKSVRCPYTEIVFTHAVRSYANFLEEKKIFYISKEFNPHRNFFGAPNPNCPLYNTGGHVLWQFFIYLLHFFRSRVYWRLLPESLNDVININVSTRLVKLKVPSRLILRATLGPVWFILTCL